LIDLKEFYLEEINKQITSPYNKYYDDILYLIDSMVTHTDSIIEEFKQLIQPDNEKYYNDEVLNLQFILICFYLNRKGYYIKQFPKLLLNPPPLNKFAYSDIRSYLITMNKSDNGIVRWAERRIFIDELIFVNNKNINIDLPSNIQNKFKEISTRQTSYIEMSNLKKLKENANFLENILKINNKYKEINHESLLGIISNQDIIKYRKILQSYRHSSEQSLKERNQLKEKEEFLINYGITVILGIYEDENIE